MGRSRLVLSGILTLAAASVCVSCASAPAKAERLETRSRMDADYERRLAAWPVPFEAKFIATRFGPTHVILSGPEDAPLLLLFHAMGLNALSWAPNVADLATRYRVAAVDTIGDQGRSIARRDYPESGKDYADWIADMIAALGESGANLAGCSMGGWIATCAAVYRPGLVRSLIVVSPAAGIPIRTTWGSMLGSIVMDRSEKNIRRIASRLFGPGRAGEDWLDYFLMATQDTEAIKIAVPTKLRDAELEGIGAPTLLLIGDGESVYVDPAEVFARASRLIPREEGMTIPNAGHLGHYDNPQYVDREMLRFLAVHGAGAD